MSKQERRGREIGEGGGKSEVGGGQEKEKEKEKEAKIVWRRKVQKAAEAK